MNLVHTGLHGLRTREHPWLDPALYPFVTRRFATPHGAMSYIDEGAGKGAPVLFVHGTPSWSFEWRNVISRLSERRRCIAVDHLGFGLSDKPPAAPLSPAAHAARLASLVDDLGLDDLTLVVHDFGGPIGLPLALDRPERISHVVIVNTWMWPNGDDPAARQVDRLVRSPLGPLLYRWLNASPRWLLPSLFADRTKLTKAAHRHYVGPFRERRDREAPFALARALVGADPFYGDLWSRREKLAGLPMTIVWGDRDPAFGDAHLARWAEAFPHARVRRLPATGHFVGEENPEALVDVLREEANG